MSVFTTTAISLKRDREYLGFSSTSENLQLQLRTVWTELAGTVERSCRSSAFLKISSVMGDMQR